MKILIGGGRGFIGSALIKCLGSERHQIRIISGKKRKNGVTWEEIHNQGLPPCDAVINLSGVNIFTKRWFSNRKVEIYSSRVDTTRILANAIDNSSNPPQVWIHVSAVGWYPTHSSEGFTENDGPHGDDFIGHLCREWEEAAQLTKQTQVREVTMRLGPVLAKEGGALKKILPGFKAGFGACLGTGRQAFPWIHIQDLLNFFLFALQKEHIQGIYNLVSPQKVNHAEFSQALARHLKRPLWFKIPVGFLHILLGERANLLIACPIVIPKRVIESGFVYKYPAIDAALSALLDH